MSSFSVLKNNIRIKRDSKKGLWKFCVVEPLLLITKFYAYHGSDCDNWFHFQTKNELWHQSFQLCSFIIIVSKRRNWPWLNLSLRWRLSSLRCTSPQHTPKVNTDTNLCRCCKIWPGTDLNSTHLSHTRYARLNARLTKRNYWPYKFKPFCETTIFVFVINMLIVNKHFTIRCTAKNKNKLTVLN